MTLTEQWKKGELEWCKNYYCRNTKTDKITICFLVGNTWYSCDDDGDTGIDWQHYLEVLAPVPSYEEWQQMKEKLEKAEATLLDIDGGWVTDEIRSKVSEYFVYAIGGKNNGN